MQKLLTIEEKAEEINVSEMTLWRWREQGIGPEWRALGPKTIRYFQEERANAGK